MNQGIILNKFKQSHLIVMESAVFQEDSDDETGELVLQSGSVILGDARGETL